VQCQFRRKQELAPAKAAAPTLATRTIPGRSRSPWAG